MYVKGLLWISKTFSNHRQHVKLVLSSIIYLLFSILLILPLVVTFQRISSPIPSMTLVLVLACYGIALIPAYRYIAKCIPTLQEAGYFRNNSTGSA
jgi:hypothetical protein